ncbi:MAG: hypothetical protein HAW63_03525 [Bdellovibrionaceae bacterium]|nr:hypothetical protein [Pseudobdellovibrionaceae bacterium]
MLKLGLLFKTTYSFFLFKILPSFLILNAGLESDTALVELVSSPVHEISMDSAASAYAVIEDSSFLVEEMEQNNKSIKNIKTPLYAISFLKAHQNFAVSAAKGKRNIASASSETLSTGNIFNWSAWYTEMEQKGGGLTLDQRQSQNLMASANFKTTPQQKTKSNKSLGPAISGKFLLKDGLFINGSEVFIYQMHNGLKVSEAKIDYQKARFFLKNAAFNSYIVAELRSNSGELIGFSKVRTSSLTLPAVLPIRDVSKGLKGLALSSQTLWGGNLSNKTPSGKVSFYAESLDRKILKSKGLYRDINMSKGSNYLLGAYHLNHWPSLSFGNTFSLSNLYSFSKSIIDSFLYLLEWDLEISNKPSIVWGRISYKGRPVQGAKLQLYNSNIKPIYFDSWVPNKELSSTSASGLFAFVGLESGVNSIGVQFAQHSYNSKFVPVQSGAVSFVDFIESKNRKKHIIPYDLFSKKFVQAKVKLLGSDYGSFVTEGGKVVLPQQKDGENLQLFEVEPKNTSYQALSILSFSNKNQLEIPMLRKAWLSKMAKNITLVDESSVLIGVSQKTVAFSANIKPLLDSPPHLKRQLFYFDKQWQTYKQPNKKTIGFIAFNLPRGSYSANVVTRHNSVLQTATKLVISEPKSVQILQF